MMHRRLIRVWSVVAALAALLAFPGIALADATNWTVTYNSAGRMVDDYDQEAFAQVAKDLQPGDDMTLTVTLVEENSDTADWYMRNQVINALEDATAQGGAYTYHLEYESSSGEVTELFDSERVGGDNRDLSDATTTLDEFFYLDTLATGKTGTVRLRVALDGDTQGDVYFNTDAILALRFAVEPRAEENTNKEEENNRSLVRTGDDTKLLPLYIAMVVSGVGMAALAMVSVRMRRQEREEAMR
jgi:hypothetical protein